MASVITTIERIEELESQYRGIDWLTPRVLDRVIADITTPDHFAVIAAVEDRGSAMSDAEPEY